MGGHRHLTVGSVAVMLIILLQCETVTLRDKSLTARVLGDARGTPGAATTTTKGNVYSQHIICASTDRKSFENIRVLICTERGGTRSRLTEHWLFTAGLLCGRIRYPTSCSGRKRHRWVCGLSNQRAALPVVPHHVPNLTCLLALQTGTFVAKATFDLGGPC